MTLFLDETELAARWRISRRTLQRWRQHHRGPAFLRIAGKTLYRDTDIVLYETRLLIAFTEAEA